MERLKIFIVVILTVLLGMIGACKAMPGFGSTQAASIENTIPYPDSTRNVSVKSVLNVEGEDKGCLSCHEGIEVINDRMQPYLLLFAQRKYGKGYGYECAICHEGVPSSGKKEESHKGLIPKGTFPYGNFNMVDTDGQTPCVGTDKYKEWTENAIKLEYLRRLERVEEIPDFEKGVSVFGSGEKAGFSDTYRKQCARCHVGPSVFWVPYGI